MVSSHARAILQALFVTFIWSLSWVLIKIGLQDIPALLFAGLRYSIASVCLLGLLMLRPDARLQVRQMSRSHWLQIIVLGLVFYTFTQGAQFLALVYLPAVTLSLMLNFTTILVALGGFFIQESPNRFQWTGIGLFIGGVLIYFGPVGASSWIGLFWGTFGVISNAAAAVLGRYLNREKTLLPLVVTALSMTIGSALLLCAGLLTGDLPGFTPSSWGIVIWLAVVHTAFAFTLWNHTLRQLQAFESSLINGTMLIQIALLAWLFLGESITYQGMFGLALAVAGNIVVQLGQQKAATS